MYKLNNNFKSNRIQNFWSLVRGENRSSRGKSSQSGEPTKQTHTLRRVRESNPGHNFGNESSKMNANALTTAPTLLFHKTKERKGTLFKCLVVLALEH